ncbi:hypothetical protein C2G38_2125595, partial [Gigaspora rosea]
MIRDILFHIHEALARYYIEVHRWIKEVEILIRKFNYFSVVPFHFLIYNNN